MKKTILSIVFVLILASGGKAIAQGCDAPVINSFSPNTGFIGSTVTISGSYFDPVPANNQVFFGATQAEVVAATFGKLTVKVPKGATYAPITVKNGCSMIGASTLSFNGIFCPTTITPQTYNTVSYQQPVSGGYQMVSQDMDLDGKPDLLVTGFSRNTISIVRNTSVPENFNFDAEYKIALPGATRCQVPADFDGDGKLDIAVTVTGRGTYVFKNNSTPGNLSFTQAAFYAGGNGYQIAAGDLNNDGKIDLVNTQGSVLYTYRNTSTPGNISFVQNTTINNLHHATGLAIVDVDGNGVADVGTSSGPSSVVTAIRNTTAPGATTFTFASTQAFATGSAYPYRLFLGDFDKDSKVDFVANNHNGATTSIFRNSSIPGTISFATPVNLASTGANYRLGVGDADGDGDADIVTKSSGVHVFSVYENRSTGPGNISFAPRIDYPGQAEVSGVLIADLDGDNVPDIATSGISYNTLRVHRNRSTVTDNEAPAAITKNIVVALDPNGTTTISPEMVDNGSSDACGIGSLSLDKTTFNCTNIGDNQVVLTVTDRAGNVSTANATVTVMPAAIIVAGQTTVCQGGSIPMIANLGDSYQWLKDGVEIPGATAQSYTALESGAYTVSVMNAGGCSGTSLPTNITISPAPAVSISPAGPASLCSGSLTLTASEGSVYKWSTGATSRSITVTQPGMYSVTVTNEFGCANTSQTVTVNDIDNINPTIIVKDIIVALKSDGTASVSVAQLNDGSFDNCATDLQLVLEGKTSFSCEDIGQTIQVKLKGTDGTNVSFAIANVTIQDPNSYCNAVPVAVSKPLTVSADENCQSLALAQAFDGGSTDADGDELSFDVAPAGPYAIGTTNVVLTVTDTKGASSTSNTTITVVDSTNPTVATPAIVNAITDPSKNTASNVSLGTPAVTDCSATAAINDAPTVFKIGTTTVTWTITDAAGNFTKVTQTVTVKDTEAPVVKVKNHKINMSASGIATLVVADVNNGSTDNDGIASVAISQENFSCANVGPNEVTLTVTDHSGNVSKAVTTVTVIDDIAPIVLTQDQTIYLDKNGNASITAQMINKGSSDACGIASVRVSKQNFSCENVGENTVTLTVTDVNGNSATASATVTVVDNVAPVALAKNVSVTLAGGKVTITPEMVNNGSNDACGIASVEVSQSAFDCSNIGDNPVTLKVTDKNGNVSLAYATVKVIGVIPTPSILVKPSSNINNGAGDNTIFLGYGSQSVILQTTNATSATGATTYTWSPMAGLSSSNSATPVFTPTAAGIYFFTVTATNEFGCSETATASVQVIDARCGKKNEKVLVCHKGQEICISANAVQAHLAHGCSVGSCNTNATNATATDNKVTFGEQAELIAFPNPFDTKVTLEFALDATGKFRLELYDMKGSLISVIAKGDGENGSYHSYELEGSNLAKGVYMVRLVTAKGVKNIKLIRGN